MLVKFRFWDSELKEWAENAQPLIEGDTSFEVIGFKDSNGVEKLVKDGHYVVSYTGVRDKDGTEIYDGDIVNVLYNHIGRITIKNEKGAFNIGKYLASEVRVVSNIYENK